MRALVHKDGKVLLQERAEPVVASGEVLLQVRLAGICSTDLEIARGYMGFNGVLGHEVLGDVIQVSDEGLSALNGKRVVSEINCSCLTCQVCLDGGRNHCPHRSVLGILNKDGGMADRVAVPAANLHVVPDSISDEAAVFIEPLAAALHAFDPRPPAPNQRVLIIGDGKLGLLIGLSLAPGRQALAELTVVGKHAPKLEILRRAGVDTRLLRDFDGRGYDVVVEATGSDSGLALALSATRPRGTIVLKSTYAGGAKVDLAPIVINELDVVGSRCGNFPRAISMLEAQKIDPRPLIDETLPLSEAEHAFAKASEAGTLKVLLRPDS